MTQGHKVIKKIYKKITWKFKKYMFWWKKIDNFIKLGKFWIKLPYFSKNLLILVKHWKSTRFFVSAIKNEKALWYFKKHWFQCFLTLSGHSEEIVLRFSGKIRNPSTEFQRLKKYWMINLHIFDEKLCILWLVWMKINYSFNIFFVSNYLTQFQEQFLKSLRLMRRTIHICQMWVN